KGKDACDTGLIEIGWCKPRMIEIYLKVAGWATGVYCAKDASRHWFNKSAVKLTAQVPARLADIPPCPRRYNAAAPGHLLRPGGHGHGAPAGSGRLRRSPLKPAVSQPAVNRELGAKP